MKNVLLSPYDTLGTDYTNPCEIISYPTGHGHHHQAERIETNTPSFKLYPNPNNGNMTFEYSLSPTDNGQLEIVDMLGQSIKIYPLQQGNDNKLQISESTLKNGVYFYRSCLKLP